MLRINIISLKGGVGKSLIAFKLATKLAINKNVVLIDRSLSKNISTYFGIKDQFGRGNYWKDVDNIRIVRFDYPAEESDVIEEYKRLMPYDVMIVDNPSLPSDEFFELDLISWVKASNSYTYNSIIVLSPPGELIDQSIRLILPINNFLKEILQKNFPVSNVNLFKAIGIIVNQTKSDYHLDYERVRRYFRDSLILTLPFRKELLQRPFEGEFKELDYLAEYIRTMI